MRVLVDALAARTGGGLTYLRSLLPAAAAADPKLEIVAAVAPGRLLEELDGVDLVEVAAADVLQRRLAWEQLQLPSLARDLDADLIFAPSEIAPLRAGRPLLVGFQNPNLFEPYLERDLRQYLRLRSLLAAARLAARRADGLVFVSDAFRGVAEPRLASGATRGYTVTVGLDSRFTPDGGAGAFASLQPYVLCVSDIYRYKSIPVAVQAFARVARSRPELRLVLAGRPVNSVEARRITATASAQGVGDRLVQLDAVPFAQMPDLYRGASCFVFPSILESLGLPPLEALACGVAVAAARASVMPALLGDAVDFFAPGDVEAAAAAIERCLAARTPPPAAAEVLARHDRAASGSALAAVFRDVARGG